MPPYTTNTAVNAYCPRRPFTASSYPTATQVSQFVAQTAADIDGILAGKGYVVPIATSSPVAFAVVERGNAIGAWANVEAAADSSDDVDRAQREWERFQQQLRDGELGLPDAPRLSSSSFARSSFPATPYFTREMEL